MRMQRLAPLVTGIVGLCCGCGGRIAPDAIVDPPEVAAVVSDAPVDAAPRYMPPRHPNPFHTGDDWRGIYSCAQGVTNLDLKIIAMHGDVIDDALFDFDWRSGNVAGSYHLSGAFDPETSTASLTPRAWVSQPSGWSAVGMNGNAGSESFSGNITNEACGSFAVQKL